VRHEPRPGPPDLLDGQLHPNVTAGVAVIEDSDSPGDLRALGIVRRMIVTAMVGELLHVRS
jgi:hypothetical protein